MIHKQPDRKEIVAGIMVGELNNTQLHAQLRRELSDINKMISDTGDKPFLDVEVGEIHHGPKLEQVVEAEVVDDKTVLKRRRKVRRLKKQRMVPEE